MPAYATPHSTERDGHLHFVAPVAPPKRALRFFSHCGLAATRAPESGRSDLLYDNVMKMGAQNEHRSRQLGSRLRGRPAWTFAPMRGWSRPGVVFERLLRGSRVA